MSSRIAAAALATLGYVGAAVAASDKIDIPFTRFTLPNGLTVVVHEDHKAPVVAVSIGTTSVRPTSRRARPDLPNCSSI